MGVRVARQSLILTAGGGVEWSGVGLGGVGWWRKCHEAVEKNNELLKYTHKEKRKMSETRMIQWMRRTG